MWYRTGRLFIVVIALLFWVLSVGTVAAQSPTTDPTALLSRIEFLERQVRILGDRVRVPSGGAPGSDATAGAGADAGSPATARLSVRISELEQELQSITGRIEEVSFQVRRLGEKLDRLSSDVDYRLGQQGAPGARPSSAANGLEPGAPPAATSAAPQQSTAAGPRVLGTLPASEADKPKVTARADEAPTAASPSAAVAVPPPASAAAEAPGPQASTREQYAYAFGLMQKQKYPESQQAFQDFLKKYPEDPLAENAAYWLGETYYAQGDYTHAATTFLENYEKHKTGAKAPDTLLKLGMSLGQLKKTKEACATFQELNKAFPAAPTSIKSRANDEKRRLGCG